MKIKDKLKIIGFNWTIEDSKEIAYQGNCYGSTHHNSQKIFLDPEMTQQKREQVVIHEIMHSIWWQMGLGERFKENKNLEEEVINTLSHGLYQVFNDNDMLK